MAGYSGTPLAQKLGLKAGQRAVIVQPPEGYAALLGDLPADLHLTYAVEPLEGKPPPEAPLDFIQLFAADRVVLERDFRALAAALKPDGTLWISWPKRASKVPTDLDENVIRAIGLGSGMVDVKVAAVDEVWSALKFVYRVADRR